ncbi:hypothetical protein R1flu_027920 [Riccia fluitans]|uniref:Uncharacterized protein n=1 Tax=Riccia fluitans TaxID=41844 RepID=A0ABD1XK86_9MARC
MEYGLANLRSSGLMWNESDVRSRDGSLHYTITRYFKFLDQVQSDYEVDTWGTRSWLCASTPCLGRDLGSKAGRRGQLRPDSRGDPPLVWILRVSCPSTPTRVDRAVQFLSLCTNSFLNDSTRGSLGVELTLPDSSYSEWQLLR